MRFPNVKVNRKNVEGKKILYWIRKANIVIIDYEYPLGDIYIYKRIKSTKSENLKDVLEEYLGRDEIMAGRYLEIQELKDNHDIRTKLFESKLTKK